MDIQEEGGGYFKSRGLTLLIVVTKKEFIQRRREIVTGIIWVTSCRFVHFRYGKYE